MELELKFAELACCEPVGDLVTTQEESMETAIPEYCPDIARIVDTVGQLRLREKHPAGQQLTMGGSVVLTALYTSEESAGLRSLSMEVPFSCQVEDKRLAGCDAVCVTGRLLLAEDGEFLRGLADDLEAGTPAQALAELFTRLLQEDMPTLQKYEKRLTALEEDLMQDQAQDLDKKLFRIRRELSVFAAYYEQLDDLFAVLSEETEEGDPHASRLFDHLTGRAQRLLSATEQEKEYALQLREMHQTQLDMRQNQIMKILTIVTTVFLPLSLIAGWYGMNFVNMPELTARHGYLAVCIVSAVCILVELVIFKWKKWL